MGGTAGRLPAQPEWKDTEMFKSNRWRRLALKAALAMPLSASAAQEPTSAVSEQELGDLVRTRFNQGRDTPIDRAAQMLLFLVSGRADALSGRFILVQDNAEELVRRAEEIQREDLHILALRT